MAQPDSAPRPDQTGRVQAPEEDEVRVGRGQTASVGVHLEEDRYIGVRVNHTLKPAGAMPPEEASVAGDDMASGEMNAIEQAAEAAAPIQDIRITPEEPSVWEAISDSEEE